MRPCSRGGGATRHICICVCLAVCVRGANEREARAATADRSAVPKTRLRSPVSASCPRPLESALYIQHCDTIYITSIYTGPGRKVASRPKVALIDGTSGVAGPPARPRDVGCAVPNTADEDEGGSLLRPARPGRCLHYLPHCGPRADACGSRRHGRPLRGEQRDEVPKPVRHWLWPSRNELQDLRSLL